jgi:hypothetical protein
LKLGKGNLIGFGSILHLSSDVRWLKSKIKWKVCRTKYCQNALMCSSSQEAIN